jgi:hypothetical protein
MSQRFIVAKALCVGACIAAAARSVPAPQVGRVWERSFADTNANRSAKGAAIHWFVGSDSIDFATTVEVDQGLPSKGAAIARLAHTFPN